MRNPNHRELVAILVVFSFSVQTLSAQFADRSVAIGINGLLPQSVLNNPQIVLFYWSPTWNTVSPYSENQINQSVLLMIRGDGVTPTYFQKSTQYTDTAGDLLLPVLPPTFSDTSTLNLVTECGLSDPGTSVNSVTLTTWVQCMLDGSGSIGFAYPPTVGTPDTLPMFFLPATAALNNDNLSLTLTLIALDSALGTLILLTQFPNGIQIPNGCSDFYGYHFWTSPLVSLSNPFTNTKLRIPYAVIPLQCFTASSPLASDPSGFFTSFDDLSEGISHELVEGLVDPYFPLGWIDFSKPKVFAQGEAADLCSSANNRNPHVWYQNQIVAAYWSNQDDGCVAGNNTVSTLTLAAAFRNDGPATMVPKSLTFQLDVRSGKLIAGNGPTGNNYTFDVLQVVNGTTHSYNFPSTLLQTPVSQVVPVDANQPVQGTEVINGNTNRTVNYKTQYYVSVLAPALANATPPSNYFDIGNLSVATSLAYTDRAGIVWQFFNWIGSATVLTNNFTANVNQSLSYQAQYVRDVTSDIAFIRSGLTYNRSTQTYYGTITLTNKGTEILSNVLPVAVTGLPAGATLVNAAGNYRGAPYVNTATASGLPPGASTTIPVLFKISGNSLNYGVSVYSFH